MVFILKYLVIYPLIFMISILEFLIDCCKINKNKNYENLAQKLPYSVLASRTESTISYRSVLSKDLYKLNSLPTNIHLKFVEAVEKFKNEKALGTREILSIDDEKQPNGKIFKKYTLANDYTWITYLDMLSRVNKFANGLLKLGLKSNSNLVILSETRQEWLISALACFKIKVIVVTLYPTLGLEALTSGINEANATFIIASGESIAKVEKIIDKIPDIKYIIDITDNITEKNVSALRMSLDRVLVYTFNEVIQIGQESGEILNFSSPNKDDLAIIMYTSGSTGNPKGVMITHGNILSTLNSVMIRLGNLSRDDVYIGYLPTAHVLELMCELGIILKGIPIGYSNILTLTDQSTAIKSGQLGDLRVLKPTLMTCVPIVLERFRKRLKDSIATQKQFNQELINVARESKLKKIKSGKSSPILDKIIFNKINTQIFGGRLRLIICGGAILNRDLHEFSHVFFCPVIQAYGLTETCGGGTTQFSFEYLTEHIGSVIGCCEITLVNWDEGNYRINDKPNPRGEIWIGGENVTLCYYKIPDKTKEDYHDFNNIKYFATGDIGEMMPNGSLKIIDRKKDLVKLQSGEYVSLNKVESIIKLLPFVDNCCVIANPTQSFCVCLISPSVKKIESLLSISHVEIEYQKMNKNENILPILRKNSLEIINEFIEVLEKNEQLKQKFNKEILDHCLKQGLERFEIPARARFVKETWLPDTGLVTDSLKLKRKEIEKFYKTEIEILYA